MNDNKTTIQEQEVITSNQKQSGNQPKKKMSTPMTILISIAVVVAIFAGIWLVMSIVGKNKIYDTEYGLTITVKSVEVEEFMTKVDVNVENATKYENESFDFTDKLELVMEDGTVLTPMPWDAIKKGEKRDYTLEFYNFETDSRPAKLSYNRGIQETVNGSSNSGILTPTSKVLDLEY